MGESVAVWVPDSVGPGGKWVSISGARGEPGKALAIKGVKATVGDLPTPGVEGDLWIVAADGNGYAWDASATPPAYINVGRIQGPAGPQGPAGVRGADGAKGDAGSSATVSVGTVSTGAAGSAAHVTNTGTANAAILNFTIPAGTKGDTGATGPAPTLSVVSTTDTAAGNPATVTVTNTGAGAYGLSFVIPQGAKGPPGSSITFHGVASSWPPPTPAAGDVWQIGSPAPAGAPAPAGHMVTYNGTAWVDGGMIKGDKGDAGPTTVSVDAGNVARLGADGLLFVPAGATPIATKATLGGVIVGTGLSVDATGKLDALATAVPVATTTATGTVTLADANAITTKDGTKVVTAAQLVGQVEAKAPSASPTFTGQVTLADGTAAAPSLVFRGDPDTGLFHPAQDKIGVSIVGSPVAEFSTQMVTFNKGVTIGGLKYPQTAGTVGQVLTIGDAGTVLTWQHALTDSSGVVFAKPGDDLHAKYADAVSRSPGGTVQSATNRAALVIMPGTYTLTGGDLVIDHDFCDVIGVGSAPHTPAVHITGATVHVQAEDVCVTGISVGTQAFKVDGHPTPTPTQRITNCVGGNNSFGGGGGGTASGTFTNCVGGIQSFGGGGGTASGTFTNCVGGDSSFGSFGAASGTFTNCVGGIQSFGGGGGTASGTFTNCVGGDSSFGSFGAASGTFTNCVGGDSSFGNYGTLTGRLYDCRLTAGKFPTVTAPGLTRNCHNADGTYDNQGGYYGTDVSTPPTAGQAWVWDATSSKWKPGTISSGFTCADGTTKKSLDDVADLLRVFAGCAASQPLKPDGTKATGWEAVAMRSSEFVKTLPDGTVVAFDPDAMVLMFDTVYEADTTVTLPFGSGGTGAVNVSIDWGDSTAKQTVTVSGNVSHTYAKHGRYIVQIKGTLQAFGVLTCPNRAKLRDVISFGNVGLASLTYAFLDCVNLRTVPKSLPTTVDNIQGVLQNCKAFNQALPWDTSNVTNMASAFYGCAAFDQTLSWNTSKCTNFSNVFYGASAYNQPLRWDTSKAGSMSGMFFYATKFNQDISGFSFSALNTIDGLKQFLLGASAFNTAHYDALLVKWQTELNAAGSTLRHDLAPTVPAKYTKAPSAAATARAALVTAGWNITDGGPTP